MNGAAVSVERFFQLSLVGLVTCGYLAVAGSGYLDLPVIVLTGAGLLLRLLWVTGLMPYRLPERVVTAVALACIGFFPIDYYFLSRDFLTVTIHMVFVLAVTKVLSAQTNRDYLYTAVIAFLQLLAAAVVSANLNFFIFLALYVMFSMFALTSFEIRRSGDRGGVVALSAVPRFHFRLGTLTVCITLGILLLTGGLFYLLPRTADAAFRRLVSHRYHLPGFSNQVTLGQIGEIKNSSRTVMHVMMYSANVPANLKWRGGVLEEFDGTRWFNREAAGRILTPNRGEIQVVEDRERSRTGREIIYRVDLDLSDSQAMFIAGTPEYFRLNRALIVRGPHDTYRLGSYTGDVFRYEVYARLEDGAHADRDREAEVRRRYLQLPPLDPRIPVLARDLTAGSTTDMERARALEMRLRHDYGYTLQLLSKEVKDPLAHFLFERKKGHCEYFAAAMTVMLRTLNIPARLVNGFQNGAYNPLTDLYVIRASDAHSWVEAWIPQRGWVTFDPTPPDPRPPTSSILDKLALYADAADTFWQDWVLSYDLNRQATLAERVDRGTRRLSLDWLERWRGTGMDWKRWALAILQRYGGPVLFLIMFAGGLWIFAPRWWRVWRLESRMRRIGRGRVVGSDATLLYGRMLELLRRRGYQKPTWLTPQEFAASLPHSEFREVVMRFTIAYNAFRFGGEERAAGRLSSILRELERQEK